ADRRLAADERRDQSVRRLAGRKPLQYERDPAAAVHLRGFVEQDGLERTLDPRAERGQRAHRFQRGLAALELFDQRGDELGGPELAGGGDRGAAHDEIRVPQEGEEGAEESTYSDPAEGVGGGGAIARIAGPEQLLEWFRRRQHSVDSSMADQGHGGRRANDGLGSGADVEERQHRRHRRLLLDGAYRAERRRAHLRDGI